jgi:hypothetical protein
MKKTNSYAQRDHCACGFAGGAAFVGGRLLNGQGLEGLTGIPSLFSGGDNKQRTHLQLAEELPQTPFYGGLFNHRQDQSIFVDLGKSGEESTVEVVVTTQTVIYSDVTERQYNGRVPNGATVQQVLEPGSLDKIGEGSFITVWGRKTGDCIIADVLVYTPPEILTK